MPSPRHRLLWLLGALAAVLAIAAFVLRDAARRELVVLFTPDYRPSRATPSPGSGPSPFGVHPVQVASGLLHPTDLQFVPGGAGLAIALEQGGRARLVDLSGAGGASPPAVTPGATVLELPVLSHSELGLLGLAFHPRWAENGRVYVNYNPAAGNMRTRISEWVLRRDELGRVAAHDERVVLEVDQPYGNHNAGQLAFGPDGFLYVGLGDGGWRDDPKGNGQNPAVLLGKMLRIDVDARTHGAYGIPADNPFVGKAGVPGEIWALGLRNPWRYSFDPHGRLVVGDVGQNTWEEIDLVRAGDNLGWNVREATHCFEPKEGCRTQGLVDPIFEYGREAGSSVTGGYVYTGSAIPELAGRYVFGDFVSGTVWELKLPSPELPATGLSQARVLGKWPLLISSFGRDEQGELYLVDHSGGGVHRLVRGR